MLPETEVYNIPSFAIPELERQLARLNKKAQKTGTTPLFLIKISETSEDWGDGTVIVYHQVYIEGEPPKIDGWTFVARIDHNVDPTGASNLIYTMPGQSLPSELRNSRADCDHCGWSRRRRDTFVLRSDETGDYRQVGRTCVQDFIGMNPEVALQAAARIQKLHDLVRTAQDEKFDPVTMHDRRHINLEAFLSHVACLIRTQGWVSGKMAYERSMPSTKNLAVGSMFNSWVSEEHQPTNDDKDVALASLSWAQRQDPASSDFMHNVVTLAETGYCDMKAIGTAAWICQGYLKSESKKALPAASNSEFIGQVGERLRDITGAVILRKNITQAYSPFETYLFKILTPEGNMITVFTTSRNFDPAEGNTVTFDGTVKEHKVFGGKKETVLGRARLK